MDPCSCQLTPRELFYLARGRDAAQWEHTSSLLAMMHNLMAKRPKSPDQFNPHRARAKRRRHRPQDCWTLDDFKAMLVGDQHAQ